MNRKPFLVRNRMKMDNIKNSKLKKLKVLHLIDAKGFYGAEVMLLNLIEQQLLGKVIPVLGVLLRSGDVERPIESVARSSGIPAIRFTVRRGIDFLGGIKIIRWAKKNGISVVHTHGFTPNLIVGFLPKQWRKIPIVRTLHGWTNTKKWSKMGLYQMLDIFGLRFIEAIFAVSSAMLAKPPLENSSLKLQVIENGINAPEYNPPVSSEMNSDSIYRFCSSSSHKILSIGRLSTEKGFDNLILGVDLLVNAGIDVKLCIIGEGPQRQQLEALIDEKKLSKVVFIAGYREKAFRFMPFFDTYILTSHSEGLPITILEAMHMGIPIVATKVGGVPEALDGGKAGSLLHSNNPVDIAQHLMIFINKDARQKEKIIEKAKERVHNIYSVVNMEKKYKDAYVQTLRLS